MSAALSVIERAGLGTIRGDASVVVNGVQHDSRHVVPGDLFVAVPGANDDGTRFAPEAIAKGAVAIAAERAIDVAVPLVIVASARRALGAISAEIYGHPTRAMRVIGVTGTNGKTTTTWLIESMLDRIGARPAMMGTVVFRGPGVSRAAVHTTPEGDDIARFAREVLDHGATHLVMEVSSHALAMLRVDAVRYEVAAFTNLTQDHLDFHGTLEAYGEAKARLFTDLEPQVAVVCVDSEFGVELAKRSRAERTIRVSRSGAEAELVARSFESTRTGIEAEIAFGSTRAALRSPLIGDHNVENLLVAIGCGLALGYDLETICAALSDAKGAPGRLERVETDRDLAVLVDYAHTPDALVRALAALRPITPGRLLVVFGCGGDRDRGKRPLMGEAAARGADVCVVTSDNPRTEDPDAIVDAIVPGLERGGQAKANDASHPRGYVRIVDRAAAIEHAIVHARPGDTVLIAGKGHEDYQIIGTTKRPFDDREVARKALEAPPRRRGPGNGAVA